MYIRYPLSLRQVEDLLFERGIDISHETVRFWWNRFGPMFAAEIRKRRVQHRSYSLWRWHPKRWPGLVPFQDGYLLAEGKDFCVEFRATEEDFAEDGEDHFDDLMHAGKGIRCGCNIRSSLPQME